jgi:hypothetical protein
MAVTMAVEDESESIRWKALANEVETMNDDESAKKPENSLEITAVLVTAVVSERNRL